MPAFRHAICNEAYERWNFRQACADIRAAGYTGIEIAPFTLAERPGDVSAGTRRELKQTIADEGLVFVGLHWLMLSPKGLHVTTPDEALRTRSWKHIGDLIDLCADLGPDGVMIFGSPAQRATTGGVNRDEATAYFTEGLAQAAPHAERRGVRILVEALPAAQCDVVQTLDEAVSIVRQIGSPSVQTMFDTHNAVDEVEDHATLVKKHFEWIRHVHVNEMDGKHPGKGTYDFKPVLGALHHANYSGWISLEAFDFSDGPERIGRESLAYLNAEIERIQA